MRACRLGLGFLLASSAACGKAPARSDAGSGRAAAAAPSAGLPADPKAWVCPGTLDRVTVAQIKTHCAEHPDRGAPVHLLDGPKPLAKLVGKNEYDLALSEFLDKGEYRTHSFWHDQTWRLTGPCVGATPGVCTESYGVHPAVRVYYSPEVSDWLCGDREGAIPDGAMIVKEMVALDKAGIKTDAEGCMSLPDDLVAGSWAVAVKAREASFDGWYWASVARDARGNPPVDDRSAFVDPGVHPANGTAVDPTWLPTGNLFGAPVPAGTKVADVVYPYDVEGNYCVNCHASAQVESTFSDLSNVLSPGIQYRWFSSAPEPKTPLAAVTAWEPGLVPDSERPHDARNEGRHEHAEDLGSTVKAALAAGPPVYRSPFPSPLAAADPAFLLFFDAIKEVPFSETWEHRMPAETYDHVVAAASGPAQFLTSDQCAGCHDATSSNASTANLVFDATDRGGSRSVNLSPYGEWRASPMGLAGRDPVFFAQLESETNHLAAQTACIESTCLHCHGVMGQRQYAADTGGTSDACKDLFGLPPPKAVPFGAPFRRAMVAEWPGSPERDQQAYGALARDGVSCTVCHHVAPEELGKEASFTGNFVTGSPKTIVGPYDKIIAKPMVHALDLTPQPGDQMESADLCGSCHNVLLPAFSNEGKALRFSYEQSTHLEWTNSVYARPGPAARTCQACHMPASLGGKPLSGRIANVESSAFAPTTVSLPDYDLALTKRPSYPRHSLHGLNVFLNEMFEQFPLELGVRQLDYLTASGVEPSLVTGRDSMLDMAAKETAGVRVDRVEKTATGELRVVVTVVNKTGHYLPSGVGFRRLFVEIVARDDKGKALWASGRTNALGAIVKGLTDEPLASELPLRNRKAFEPHHLSITREDQAQIYEEVSTDSGGDVTTSFLHRVKLRKDNRIRPKGFDPAVFTRSPSSFIQELGERVGVDGDRYYEDPALTGADQFEYVLRLPSEALATVTKIDVALFDQSIPPAFLAARFADASFGAKKQEDTRRLYALTSRLNTAATAGREAFLAEWKLPVAHATGYVQR